VGEIQFDWLHLVLSGFWFLSSIGMAFYRAAAQEYRKLWESERAHWRKIADCQLAEIKRLNAEIAGARNISGQNEPR